MVESLIPKNIIITGKSTVFQILLRLRDPDEGIFRVNGVDARHIDRGDWFKAIGVVAQDDWVQIVPSGEGQWDVWPAERHFYLRSRELLSRDLILSENEPIIENATADYGASGRREALGRTMHEYPHERLFYDPDALP